MYWQVYLHKTVLSAENMLVNILRRAKELSQQGETLFATEALQTFLKHDYDWNDFESNPELLDIFARLDDNDVMASIKEWMHQSDRVLADLSSRLINRNLLKIKIKDEPFKQAEIEEAVAATAKKFNYSGKEAEHLIITKSIANHAYNPQSDRINLLYKNDTVQDISEAADQLNIHALSHTVVKHFLCYPAEIGR
jgi:HD superfamily phosphohydrolase